jgi:hypothetical protein
MFANMKMQNAIWTCVLAVAILLGVCGLLSRSPLRKYGVHIDKDYGPDCATHSAPFFRIWCEYQGNRVEAPYLLGGVHNPVVDYYDTDGDEIPDIVITSSNASKIGKQIVAFKPGKDGREPRFLILENTLGPL